jgi:hypothetical protein
MEQKATKEANKLQEVASCRKSISETTTLLREKIQLLMVLFDKLTISEKNLIGEDLTEVVQRESLEEGKEVDSSKWFISRTLIAIKQLNKKIDTILSSKEPKASEKLRMEVSKNE